jgi:hypothetical protein
MTAATASSAVVTRDQVVWGFGPDMEPGLEVGPGAVVTVETNDCVNGQIRSEAPTGLPAACVAPPPRPERVSEWGREDSNLRRLSRRVYSPFPLAARAHPRLSGAL